ncbi:hypothetical protein PT974_02482 [Cladobotryum mycophilum]|uniref:Up-regulated during septation protein 1 domain-containing protein n=1 Tax=Cladobotryum mycophilum TaxID=491253 RepID=A0ABR0SYQ4_9HYPO
MNGYHQTASNPYEYGGSRTTAPTFNHNGNTMPEDFDKNDPNDFENGAPPYDTMSSSQVPNTALADLKDPIQVHLLTETALSDSKDYQILTQEEVDKLKKQCLMWTQRVEVTRSNLAIQSKYRDAAISMAKLQSAGKSEEELQHDHAAREAETERRIMEKKCEQLSRELVDLEKRLLVPQRRLLYHTAGILQLTHKVSKRKAQQANGQINHGVPSSPESLYTLSHSRDSLAFPGDENYFEDPGVYQLDPLEIRQPPKSTIEIPLRSPVRDQTSQLRAEMDGMKEENAQLVGLMSEMEKKLKTLNLSLRDTIIRFNPEINSGYLEPPHPSPSNGPKPGDLLRYQIDYLESGLVAVQAEQDSFNGTVSTGGSSDQIEPVLISLWNKIQAGFAETKQRNEERRKHRAERGLADVDESDDDVFDVSEAYSLAAFSRRVDWLYHQSSTLKDQKSVLKRQIKQQRELNNKTDAEKDEEMERRQEELEQTRLLLDRAEKDAMDAQTMLSDALQDLEQARATAGSAGAADAAEEELQARSVRIESLEAEVRARSTRIESLEAEVQARSARIESLEGEIQARSVRIESLEAEIEARSVKIKAFETKVAGLESEHGNSGPKVTELNSRLDEATRDRERAEETARALQQEIEYNKADLSTKDKELAQREEEMEQLNMTIAELKTEVTIARAELDGAYGTRAERAADVAALKNNAELVKLRNHVERLKKELAGTVADLEAITKETIGAEREKIDLEHKLDEAMLDKAAVDADLHRARDQVAKLQEELDSERFKVVPGQGGTSRLGAGASMLSEQFRSTMREERKKFQEDIREERTKVRRLEEELNRLKRSQGHGKSPLSTR